MVARVGLVEFGLAALASHVLCDASGGTASILWPLDDWRIPCWAYYMGEVGLMAVSFWLAGRDF